MKECLKYLVYCCRIIMKMNHQNHTKYWYKSAVNILVSYGNQSEINKDIKIFHLYCLHLIQLNLFHGFVLLELERIHGRLVLCGRRSLRVFNILCKGCKACSSCKMDQFVKKAACFA